MLTVILQNEEDKCWIWHHLILKQQKYKCHFLIYFTQDIMAANNSSFFTQAFVTVLKIV